VADTKLNMALAVKIATVSTGSSNPLTTSMAVGIGPADSTKSYVDDGNTPPEQSGQWNSGTQGMHAKERPGRTTSTGTEGGLVALKPLTLDQGGKAHEGSRTPTSGHSLSPGPIIQVGQQQPAGTGVH
jgi:hypothetical protein